MYKNIIQFPRYIKKLLNERIQKKRVAPWFAINGDRTLRLDYDLNEDSIVFDLGGYVGDFSFEIVNKYNCYIHIFEPIPKFYNLICERFKDNPKVKVYQFGLAGSTTTMKISLDDDASSVYNKSGDGLSIELKSIEEFLTENSIEHIDLIKVNIEGAEYELLESVLSKGLATKFENIQVQFHDFIIPNAEIRMMHIQKMLSETHSLTYQYVFVWENWKLK